MKGLLETKDLLVLKEDKKVAFTGVEENVNPAFRNIVLRNIQNIMETVINSLAIKLIQRITEEDLMATTSRKALEIKKKVIRDHQNYLIINKKDRKDIVKIKTHEAIQENQKVIRDLKDITNKNHLK